MPFEQPSSPSAADGLLENMVNRNRNTVVKPSVRKCFKKKKRRMIFPFLLSLRLLFFANNSFRADAESRLVRTPAGGCLQKLGCRFAEAFGSLSDTFEAPTFV